MSLIFFPNLAETMNLSFQASPIPDETNSYLKLSDRVENLDAY